MVVSAPPITAEDYLRALENGDDGLAAYYGERLDEPVRAAAEWYERPDALALSALHYAARYGLAVFPLMPGLKRPLPAGRPESAAAACCAGTHRRGCHDASTDPELITRWWRQHPTANVGIATGHVVDVIDQDGHDGARSWALELAAGAPPRVLGIVTTPRDGGVHRYVEATGDGNAQRLAPGLDYRGRGGYVVAPPSVVDGRRYSWAQTLEIPS
jgi:hypothetical protein